MEGLIFLPLFFLVLLHVPCLSHAQDDVCADKDCGQGTCVPKSSSILGFDCVCFKGWKQFQIGPLLFPSCVFPNCTVNLQCGGSAPPSPPPTPAPLLINPFNTCNFVWCGDGTCVVNGTGHYCQCNEGSNNLLNLTDAACFKKGSFGNDCGVLGFGDGPLLTPPPPRAPLPPPSPPLPTPSARPPSNDSNTISKNPGSYGGLSLLLLSGVISVFFL